MGFNMYVVSYRFVVVEYERLHRQWSQTPHRVADLAHTNDHARNDSVAFLRPCQRRALHRAVRQIRVSRMRRQWVQRMCNSLRTHTVRFQPCLRI